jgi:hypothetical protein
MGSLLTIETEQEKGEWLARAFGPVLCEISVSQMVPDSPDHWKWAVYYCLRNTFNHQQFAFGNTWPDAVKSIQKAAEDACEYVEATRRNDGNTSNPRSKKLGR